MMKLPWRRRAHEAQASAERAHRELEAVRDRWAEVRHLSAQSARHRELNGWTQNIVTIFSGHTEGGTR